MSSAEFESKKNPITLTRMILQDSKEMGASGDFCILMTSVQLAIKVIASATSKAGISNLYGIHGGNSGNQSVNFTTNSTGDVQKKLDVLANDVFINALSFSDQIRILGSEENDEPYLIKGSRGKYSIVFDPLDGSSNIDVNVSIGTIFGVYRNDHLSEEEIARNPHELILQKGRELIAAGYVVYGPSTVLVFATNNSGVNEFTLDSSIGEFILTGKDLKIPENGKVFSVNAGNRATFDVATKEYVEECEKRQYSARYVGSMVSDIHRGLKIGGIFMYPPSVSAPNGKLRLLYEVNPISFIMQKAGGGSTTGRQNPLNIKPNHVHQRVPIFCGSLNMVKEVEALYAKHNCGLLFSEEVKK